METNLTKIKKIAEEKDDENWSFRTFLKVYNGQNLDSIVHQLFKKYSDSIDCTACGNCCRTLTTALENNDITALSKSLHISPAQFRKEYVQKDTHGNEMLTHLPCPFLTDNKCTQYESRPTECRSFPHLHKKDFRTRLIGVIDNYSICPIVFNTYEELKIILQDEFIAYQKSY